VVLQLDAILALGKRLISCRHNEGSGEGVVQVKFPSGVSQ